MSTRGVIDDRTRAFTGAIEQHSGGDVKSAAISAGRYNANATEDMSQGLYIAPDQHAQWAGVLGLLDQVDEGGEVGDFEVGLCRRGYAVSGVRRVNGGRARTVLR